MIQKKIFLLLLLFSICSFSQNKFEFGKVSTEELKMPLYEKDSTANAIILYEYGESVIKLNNYGKVELTFEYTGRIKIFNSKGYDKATIEIPLRKSITSRSKEILQNVEALAINPDRTTGALQKENVFTENLNEYYDVVKFTVPNVKEGTVIDYKYKILSPFYYNFVDWEFQSDIPKIFSQYHTSIPGNYLYNVKLVGSLKLTDRKSSLKKDCLYFTSQMKAECAVETYTMENIPAFKEEDYMTSRYNFLSAIRYELETFRNFNGVVEKYTKSWDDVDKEIRYSEDIGKQAKKSNYFKDFILPETWEIPNNFEKAKHIYHRLQDELVWNGKNHIFTDIDVKKAYETKSGSTAELNLILLNFLNAAGFDAQCMLVSTRENGKPTKLFPIISEFNYLIVKLDLNNDTYLLDITDKQMPFGMVPFKILNEYGRVMDFRNSSYWHEFTPKNPSTYKSMVQIDIEENGNVTAKVREIHSGYFGINKRKAISENSIDDYVDNLESKFNIDGGVYIEEYNITDKDHTEKPLQEDYILHYNEPVTLDFFFLNPILTNKFTKNPFTLKERTYPVDFGYPFSYTYNISINLPENYIFENIPEQKAIQLPDNNGIIVYQSLKSSEKKLMINLKLNLNKNVFHPEEYEGLKNFFKELVLLQNKQFISLKKLE
ncbi:hypothetical protein [Abyssalbus ytuae]|uniref:DUF3857 domain-containing protein n=1 Tax=Abyssalbus ytuae TaxID=2926907 RepID=A0A9E6ZNM2_9FLAO|nr:hypothetical protein [Abyssalbus ytuae]UOB17655.1 hypothetical protein MQE35_18180 [Abyssalbus ytuae]